MLDDLVNSVKWVSVFRTCCGLASFFPSFLLLSFDIFAVDARRNPEKRLLSISKIVLFPNILRFLFWIRRFLFYYFKRHFGFDILKKLINKQGARKIKLLVSFVTIRSTYRTKSSDEPSIQSSANWNGSLRSSSKFEEIFISSYASFVAWKRERKREREILFNKRGRTLVRVIVPGHFAGILKPAGSDFWSVHRDGVFIVTSQYRENRRKVKEPGPRENEREGEGERSLLHGGGFSGTMEFQPRFLAKQFRNSFRRGS